MAVFSVNQVRHLYVAKSVGSTASEGGIEKVDQNGQLYYKYHSADGIVRTDLIDKKNIISVTVTPADDMVYKRKRVKVSLDENLLTNSKPIVGQDYILKIYFKEFIGLSPDNGYYKHAAVHVLPTISTVGKFYAALAKSFILNFSREVNHVLDLYLLDAEGSTIEAFINGEAKAIDDTVEYTGILIEEAEQKDWALGTSSVTHVNFEVLPSTITIDGEEVVWGTVDKLEDEEEITKYPYKTVNNGKLIADLEYFCMGDRGDHYRNMGWPNVINTKYMVDPSKAYNVLDIHYAYVGANESVQKSEKTLTIVSENNLATLKPSV